jgi:hypothetical protein
MSRSRATKAKDIKYDESDDDVSFEDEQEKKFLQSKRAREMNSDDESDYDDSDFSKQDGDEDEVVSVEDIDIAKEGLNSDKKKKPAAKKEKQVKEKQTKAEKDKPAKPKRAKKEDNGEKKEKKEKAKKEKAEKKEKKPKEVLESAFNLEERYFYQVLGDDEWKLIKNFITDYFKDSTNFSNEKLKEFFVVYKNLKKGADNLSKLKSM